MVKIWNIKNRAMAIISIVALIYTFAACSTTSQNISPHVVRPANQIPNSRTVAAISVGAEAYSYPGQGLNYLKAGIHPVCVTVSNNGNEPVQINPESVLAHATDGQLYRTYTPQEAVQLVINSHAIEEAANGAASGAVTGAAIGALVGLITGAIWNVDPGRMAASGAVYGGIAGGAQGVGVWMIRLREAAQAEINNKALRRMIVPPGLTMSGWLFFPGNVILDELRITVSPVGTGNFLTFRLPIPASLIQNVPKKH